MVSLLWETALKFGWTCSQKYPHWSAVLAKLGAQEMCFNYHWSQYWKETLLFVTVSWSANCLCLKRKAVFLIAACQPDVPNCLQFFCFLKLRFSESIKHFLFPPSSWLSHFSLSYNSCLGCSCHPPMHVSSPAERHSCVPWLRSKPVRGHQSPWRMEDWRMKEVRTKCMDLNTQSISKVWSQQVIHIWTGEITCILIFIRSLLQGFKATVR